MWGDRLPTLTQQWLQSQALHLSQPQHNEACCCKTPRETEKLCRVAHLAYRSMKKGSGNQDNFPDACIGLQVSERRRSRLSVLQRCLESLIFQSEKYLNLEEIQRKREKAEGKGSGEPRLCKWDHRSWHLRYVQEITRWLLHNANMNRIYC